MSRDCNKEALTGFDHGNVIHGESGTLLYQAYHTMLSRCNNEGSTKYADYGARGIKVCARWSCKDSGYLNFKVDMGDRPDGKSLDRVDVNGDYSKGNCVWSTRSVQGFNRRKMAKNTSGRTGVYTRRAKFYVKVMKDGVEHWGGTHKTLEEATIAVEALELKLYNHNRTGQ